MSRRTPKETETFCWSSSDQTSLLRNARWGTRFCFSVLRFGVHRGVIEHCAIVLRRVDFACGARASNDVASIAFACLGWGLQNSEDGGDGVPVAGGGWRAE